MQNFTTLAFRSLQERMSQLAIKREWNIWNQVFLSDFDGHFTTVYITIYSPTGGRQRCVGGWQSRLWAYQLGRLQYGAALLQITSDRLIHISRF